MSSWFDGIIGRSPQQPPRDDDGRPPRRPPHDDAHPPLQRWQHSGLQLPSGTVLLERACSAIVATAATALFWWSWKHLRPMTSLHTYGRDMTGQGDPVINRVIDILCRRTKNCVALVGAAGVGKTAIAEGLAQRIATGAVPDALAGARVVEVDLGAMVAGTNLRGMFEERMKKLIKQAEASNGNVVLFIDEMHMLYSAGSSLKSCTSASNMLKPALARGRIRCVGATTFDEYRQYIEKDSALERRFQKVTVEEPTTQATIDILRGLKERYQDHHGLEIEDAALVAAAHLGSRYITGRQFPDKAIDLIDEMYGARPIKRWVQKNVITPMSEMLVKGHISEGSTIFIGVTDDKKGLKFEVVKTPVLEHRVACDQTISSVLFGSGLCINNPSLSCLEKQQ